MSNDPTPGHAVSRPFGDRNAGYEGQPYMRSTPALFMVCLLACQAVAVAHAQPVPCTENYHRITVKSDGRTIHKEKDGRVKSSAPNLQGRIREAACQLAQRHNLASRSLTYDVSAITSMPIVTTSLCVESEAAVDSDRRLACEDPPLSVIPASYDEAVAGFPGRRDAVVQAWLTYLHDQYRAQTRGSDVERYTRVFGALNDKGGSYSFRMIAAGLWALQAQRLHAEGRRLEPPPYEHVPNRQSFIRAVERWSGKIGNYGPGTAGDGGDVVIASVEGDYDMVMKEMVALLFLFRNGYQELTQQAAFNIVEKGFGNLLPAEFGRYMAFKAAGQTVPETENHVLLIYGSLYLVNDYIRDKREFEPRFRRGRYRDRSNFENRGTSLEDFLFQAAGRVLHNGFFETNARPYQGITFQGMLNLHSYAANPKLRLAYHNALDYLAAKFAFQSLEGRRFSPNRRNFKKGYSDSLEFFKNDGLNYVMGSLSGALRYRFPGGSNPAGMALWAMLSAYRLPEVIHDYMLDKHDGYWARMQARFTDDHYRLHHWPRYFDERGMAYGNHPITVTGPVGQRLTVEPSLEPAVELYFATPNFMNVAGGNYQRYKFAYDQLGKQNGVAVYDFLSVPQVLVTPGITRDWGNRDELVQDYPTLWGEINWWKSVNGGTYKGFSYGYFHAGDAVPDQGVTDYINPLDWPGQIGDAVTDVDRHQRWPMRVPARWEICRYGENAGPWADDRVDVWHQGRAYFKFYDFSHGCPNRETIGGGYPRDSYVVMARVSKSDSAWAFRKYSRGFWEILPASRFAGAKDLKEWVLANNPRSHFRDNTRGAGKAYKYKMTTGDLLELEDIVGHDVDRCYNPIKRINGRNPGPLLYDRCNKKTTRKLPLLEVFAIDPETYENREPIALAVGDGKLWIENPYLYFGTRLELDSSNYRDPRRKLSVDDNGRIAAPAHLSAPTIVSRRQDRYRQ